MALFFLNRAIFPTTIFLQTVFSFRFFFLNSAFMNCICFLLHLKNTKIRYFQKICHAYTQRYIIFMRLHELHVVLLIYFLFTLKIQIIFSKKHRRWIFWTFLKKPNANEETKNEFFKKATHSNCHVQKMCLRNLICGFAKFFLYK